MVSRRGLIGGGAAALVAAALPARAEVTVATGVGRAARRRVEALADTFLDRFKAPGLSVAFSSNGSLRYVAAFGSADRATGEALQTAHRFRIASLSKPITAAAIMVLVERGELALDRRVFGAGGLLSARFPLDSSHPQRDWLEAITVDHLLTHTAGGWTNDGRDPMFRHPGAGHDALIEATLREAPLLEPPGTSYAYSNFGYCLLGRVIEERSGKGYPGFVRDAVLAPAGAAGMSIGGNRLADRQPGEVAYFAQRGDAYGMDVTRMDAHGGWIASATEVVKFALVVDGYRSVPDILARKTVSLMSTPSAANAGYGRGWSLNPRHNNWWHTGGLPGSATILVRVDGGVCFAGLVNTRTSDPDIHDGLDSLMWDIYTQVIG